MGKKSRKHHCCCYEEEDESSEDAPVVIEAPKPEPLNWSALFGLIGFLALCVGGIVMGAISALFGS